MEDELKEEFRQLTMLMERIESNYEMLKIHIEGLEAQIEGVNDELTLPSGRMSQRFSQLEKQIQQLGANRAANLPDVEIFDRARE